LNVSVDNGANFPAASGDYQTLDANGVETASAVALFHSTASAFGRSGVIWLPNSGSAVGPKIIQQLTIGVTRFFVNSALPINALRISSITTNGNLTGGAAKVYGR
ncbi:hypothetical protein, partial [Mesorhizobium sp. M7A.F.Ca.US.002.01.1.1]|uniref:hypothetical protein n=1 Tax=Mesorhizobium sp. M7A.F.Ca.US.002.01.1.1 TaxID=2496700 RepID=UPI0013E36749